MTAPSRSESSFAKRPCASRSWSRIGSTTRIQLSDALTCGASSRGMNWATARSTETSSSVCTCVVARSVPTGRSVEPRLERRRSASPSGTGSSSNPSRRHTVIGALVRARTSRLTNARTALLRVARRTRAAAPSQCPAVGLARARGQAGCARRRAAAPRRARHRSALRRPRRGRRRRRGCRRVCPAHSSLPRLRVADRLGHLALELLPELAQDRLVRLGRAPDRHGTSEPIRR